MQNQRTMKKYIFYLLLAVPATGWAQEADSTYADSKDLEGVEIRAKKISVKRLTGSQIGFEMNKDELFKAACCNLGESFQNNASVDVNYSDAASGAKQIKLLGLSGTYVQMLTETQPNFFGGAKPFALDYVPGPWMNSIQVSKGASSVKHGFDGITGQINVAYLHPEDDEQVNFNTYASTDQRFEVNADGNIHLTDKLATNLLLHYDTRWGSHDGNKDGFMDAPNSTQYNVQNRWKYQDEHYIFHGGISGLKENRKFGQTDHQKIGGTIWLGEIDTERYEAYMKHAFVLDHEHNTNLALMANGAVHNQDAQYGSRYYNIDQKDLVVKAVFETEFDHVNSLSTGLSMERHWTTPEISTDKIVIFHDKHKNYGSEGAYVQYTMNLQNKFVLMAGVRADNTTHAQDEDAVIITPRLHVKYQPTEWMQIRASAGKGYRLIDSFWAENCGLLAMNRKIQESLSHREEAWNYGGTIGLDIPLWGKNLKVNMEYFYTHFINQAVIDYDSDPNILYIDDSKGEKGNYSHVFQIDATYEPIDGLSTTVAFRRNIVKNMGRDLVNSVVDKVFQSKYKGLFTVSYKPGMGLWQFDGSLQINGPCRLPYPTLGTYYPTTLHIEKPNYDIPYDEPCVYPAVNLQVTRWFRHWSVYLGAENLTNFKLKHPILDPGGQYFDATQVWGPVMGRMFYVGLRWNLK